MELSKTIIEVLDNICEKFGVVIDWSKENVLLYAGGLASKMVSYGLIKSWIVFVIMIILFMSSILMLYKVYKDRGMRKKQGVSSTLWEVSIWHGNQIHLEGTSLARIITGVCTGAIFVTGVILIFVSFNLAELYIFPEKYVFEYIQSYMQQGA